MLSNDFVAGYICARGTFMNIKVRDKHYPVFQIKTGIDNFDTLLEIAVSIGALSAVHKYDHGTQKYALLLIRDRETLLNKLIPILDNRLIGSKANLYNSWKEKLFNTSSTWNFRTLKAPVIPKP